MIDKPPLSTFQTGPKLAEKNAITHISKHDHYFVPMGHNFELSCDAINGAVSNGHKVDIVKWFYDTTNEKGHREITYNLIDKFIIDEGTLIGGFAQSSDEGYYTCHVLTKNGEEYISRYDLYVQNCGDYDFELTAYRNYMNPCKHGKCIIKKLATFFPTKKNISKLECKCLEDFSGVYCEKNKEDYIKAIFFFYSPVVFYLFILITMLILFEIFPQMTKKERIPINGLIPKKWSKKPFKTFFRRDDDTESEYDGN
uniref:Ig-like domain-containing protein n=1 Tax=Parastrongyloides trichosuri TaxID=131310 RepID=A0A0N4ZYJ9_PARTI